MIAKQGLGKRLRDFAQSGQFTTCLIFLPPALLLFTVFVTLPVVEAGYYGFFNWNGYGPPTKWIGLQNYVRALSDPIFHNALFNNLLVILVSALIQVPIALSVALLISDRTRSSVFLGRYFSPLYSWRGRRRPDLALYV
jgi:raffinose/stachyose/melibiose transport system permease protein